MLNKRFWKGAALVSGELLVAMAVFTVAIIVLVRLLLPWIRQYQYIDHAVFANVDRLDSAHMNNIMLFITELGKHQFLIPANLLLIAYFLWFRRHTWFSIRIAAVGLSSLALMFALKLFFMRERPADPLLFAADGYSFPSGHALMSATFYGLMIYIAWKKIASRFLRILLTVFFVVLILAIGLSRVYLRVHYASDVIAGLLVGTGWLFVSMGILKRIEAINKKVVPAMPVEKDAGTNA